MTGPSSLTDEASSTKVAAVFANGLEARMVAARICKTLRLSDAQVQVITPTDPRPGRKLEPESHGIFRTMLRAHALLGIAGAVVGGVVFGVLWSMGIRFIVNSPLMAAAVLIAFGGVAGLMLGGLVTLRPDHDPYIYKVREALGEGHSAVVVHAFSHDQSVQARGFLLKAGGEVISTL